MPKGNFGHKIEPIHSSVRTGTGLLFDLQGCCLFSAFVGHEGKPGTWNK